MKVVVALGGNAIQRSKEKGTVDEQFRDVRLACKHLAEIVESGHTITITHGNGPQVGDILLKDGCAKEALPPVPLDVCGAESQGMIGYMTQQSVRNELALAGINPPVATVLTETIVDANDPAFKSPTKSIGLFYTAVEATLLAEDRGWQLVNDGGRGFRRAVPSPAPVSIVEGQTIKTLVESGTIVIAAGGGGISVTCGVTQRVSKQSSTRTSAQPYSRA